MAATRNPDQTRQALLDAAFEEIHEHGFQAASLDNILANTGVTKGALYHHFKNKMELGYAVVEEIIRPMMREIWLVPLGETDDLVEGFRRIFEMAHQESDRACQCGCPLNNLAQEMSPLDEGFRKRIQTVFEAWKGGIADSLERGQTSGTVRTDIDVDKTATFILASLEGIIGLAKNSQDPAVFDAGRYSLEHFLHSLRPAAVAAG